MIHLLLAGIDARFHKEVRRKVGSLEKAFPGLKVSSVPLVRHPGAPAYPRPYVIQLAGLLGREVLKHSGDQSALVSYVDWDESSSTVVSQFSPYSILHSVRPPEATELAHHHFSQEVNRIIAETRKAMERFTTVIGAVQFELTNRRNRTPYLLPLKNFDSEVLRSILQSTAGELLDVELFDGARELLAERSRIFFTHHPQARQRDKWAHRNDAGIVFCPSGRDLHGIFGDAEGHLNECRLGARLRLGHSYPEGFHYHMAYEPQSQSVRGSWPSCHGMHTARGGMDYLNIAPNDFIRDGT